jgi:hypothetical protein
MESVWRAIAKLQAERTDLVSVLLLELVFQLFVMFWADVAAHAEELEKASMKELKASKNL